MRDLRLGYGCICTYVCLRMSELKNMCVITICMYVVCYVRSNNTRGLPIWVAIYICKYVYMLWRLTGFTIIGRNRKTINVYFKKDIMFII